MDDDGLNSTPSHQLTSTSRCCLDSRLPLQLTAFLAPTYCLSSFHSQR